MCADISVPIINIDSLFIEETKNYYNISNSIIEECMLQLDNVMSTLGVFIVKFSNSHSNLEELQSFSASKKLFSSNSKFKKEYALDMNGLRGYIERGFESGLKDTIYEPKEGYSYGHPHTNKTMQSNSLLQSPNIWPDGVASEDIITLESQYLESNNIAEVISSAISSKDSNIQPYALGGAHNSLMRLFKYDTRQDAEEVEEQEKVKKNILGSSPHKDWGFITVIKCDDYGLQFLYEDTTEWIDVPYVPSSYTVIVGEYLSFLSNGFYKAPVHRVLTDHDKVSRNERISFVYFYYPKYDAPIYAKSSSSSSSGSSSESVLRDDENAEGKEFQFNTIFDAPELRQQGNSSRNGSNSLLFGDIVLRKWRRVQNTNADAYSEDHNHDTEKEL